MAENNFETTSANKELGGKTGPIILPPPPPPTPQVEKKLIIQIALAIVTVVGIFYLLSAFADLQQQLFGLTYRERERT